jgi:glycosyltransferase involved in cell wall biosynthesis
MFIRNKYLTSRALKIPIKLDLRISSKKHWLLFFIPKQCYYMDSKPFFTIITVFLNDSKKIEVTLDSLYQQTCQDYEHLIKDACSQTQEIELLKKYVMTSKTSVVSSPDIGIYSGMNQSLSLSNGRFLYFLNSGDYFHDPFVLEKAKDFITSNSKSSIFYGDIIWQPSLESTHYPERITKSFIFKKNICHQAIFVDREKLLGIGGFREQMLLDKKSQAIQSDQESLWELVFAQNCEAAKLPIKVAFFERGGFSTSSNIFLSSWLERAALLIKQFSLAEFIIYGSATFLLAPLKRYILLRTGHQHTTTLSKICRDFFQRISFKG